IQLSASRRFVLMLLALTSAFAVAFAGAAAAEPPEHGDHGSGPPTSPHGRGIDHVFVIDLENEDFETSFGPESPAHYLNETIVPAGVLLQNYYATGHASTDNYIAQVSGQAPNEVSGSDCISD